MNLRFRSENTLFMWISIFFRLLFGLLLLALHFFFIQSFLILALALYVLIFLCAILRRRWLKYGWVYYYNRPHENVYFIRYHIISLILQMCGGGAVWIFIYFTHIYVLEENGKLNLNKKIWGNVISWRVWWSELLNSILYTYKELWGLNKYLIYIWLNYYSSLICSYNSM